MGTLRKNTLWENPYEKFILEKYLFIFSRALLPSYIFEHWCLHTPEKHLGLHIYTPEAFMPSYISEHYCLHTTQLEKHSGLHTSPFSTLRATIGFFIPVRYYGHSKKRPEPQMNVPGSIRLITQRSQVSADAQWRSKDTALWAKLLRKWEIGKITSWTLIFWKLYYFRWIWRKMSLSLSIFLVLPQISLVKYYETIKILMQIFSYFQIPFSQWRGSALKKLFWGFF